MRHAAQASLATALGQCHIATLRFNFPYMQAGKRRVDAQPVAVAAIAAAVQLAGERWPHLPLCLSGHSFGGRMASHAVHEGLEAPVQALVFGSFPLHPAGKPGVGRAAHLPEIRQPMLFLSGTRDALARADLLEQTVAGLGGRARLHWLDTADHGYRVLKRSRATSEDVFDEMARVAAEFIAVHVPATAP